MDEDFFIKTTEQNQESKLAIQLTAEQKARLNRKGNEAFNNGDIQTAARIFVTTSYSDGLTRLGDYFMKQNDRLTALRYYSLAHNKNNIDALISEIAAAVSLMLKE